MCFSPSASFAAAAALSIISALSFKNAKSFTWKLFAVTPLFFAIQQLFEGFVWLTLLQGDTMSMLHKSSMYGFLFFASIFWPCWIPEIFYLLENNFKRKVLLGLSQSVGIAFAIVAAAQLYTYGATAHIADHHIVYNVTWNPQVLTNFSPAWIEPFGMVIYLLAVLLPFFISSISYAWILGLIVAAGFVVAHIAYYMAFGSVWCFFAAIASMLVYFMVSKKN